jgi:predicted RNase H-like nuclease (RuvC/YqgF family)
MVSIVVQQVREAKAKERHTVVEECEQEFAEKLAHRDAREEELKKQISELEERVKALEAEIASLRTESGETVPKSQAEAKDSEIAALSADKSFAEDSLAKVRHIQP